MEEEAEEGRAAAEEEDEEEEEEEDEEEEGEDDEEGDAAAAAAAEEEEDDAEGGRAFLPEGDFLDLSCLRSLGMAELAAGGRKLVDGRKKGRLRSCQRGRRVAEGGKSEEVIWWRQFRRLLLYPVNPSQPNY